MYYKIKIILKHKIMNYINEVDIECTKDNQYLISCVHTGTKLIECFASSETKALQLSALHLDYDVNELESIKRIN